MFLRVSTGYVNASRTVYVAKNVAYLFSDLLAMYTDGKRTKLNWAAAKAEPFKIPENNPSLVISVNVWLRVPGYENLALSTGKAW
mgnify:FL=1